MYNKKGESNMDKTILVVEVIKYKNIPTAYNIKKTANSLQQASEYLVSLRNLNDAENTTYELFNAFGQFEVEEIKKIESEETDEIRF
jgi:hypothetical protein|tara:strand:+ start:212 stop:472 length:261 start_codon:yes stop_codon:yes gene_type:complete